MYRECPNATTSLRRVSVKQCFMIYIDHLRVSVASRTCTVASLLCCKARSIAICLQAQIKGRHNLRRAFDNVFEIYAMHTSASLPVVLRAALYAALLLPFASARGPVCSPGQMGMALCCMEGACT